jgi:biotin-dependent carboxylase-like uncharacterized protein
VLVVERCGPGVSVQDDGRFGWRRHGVPVSGAMDGTSLAVANRLVGNPDVTAAVELTLAGASFRIEGGAALVAAAGPGVVLSVAGRPVPAATSAVVPEGEHVAVSAVRGGTHAYLAVGGGLAGPSEMGSRSMHARSGIGGTGLAPGDRLPIGDGGAATPLTLGLPAGAEGSIRVMMGPQADAFDGSSIGALLATRWTVDDRADRMGRFLVGATISAPPGSMVSDGVVPGSVQVPPSGVPVVLMRDCQTTGGYPKIATVITADLNRFAQLPPGASFSFAVVERGEAVRAARAAAAEIAALLPRPAEVAPTLADLLRANLVSGVVDARD